jgi:hypothetical protein
LCCLESLDVSMGNVVDLVRMCARVRSLVFLCIRVRADIGMCTRVFPRVSTLEKANKLNYGCEHLLYG